jgi:dTDP-4-amino-4,6-dideoxygalactose transaminase
MSKLAISGGKPVRDKKGNPWPSWPVFGVEERKRLIEVFESGKWWYGERIKEFEQKFSGFQDARYGITCTNGTAALEIGLLACGVKAGDEVIVPPYTFIATASSVLRVNAIPVFADIDLTTANLDPADTERKITEKTRAIMPVHFAGLPCDMDAFNALAGRYNLKVIEDACHSWGSKWKGKGTGALGDCGGFSFQMSKNITSGEGGIVITDDEQLAETARSYSNIGRVKDKPWYEHYILGTNLRMTELQAAILLGQFTRLEEQTEKREENAVYLDRIISQIPGIEIIFRDKRITRRSYHLYIFRFNSEVWGVSREGFIEGLKAEGIPVSSGYPHPLYRNPLFQKKGSGPEYCPISCPYYNKDIDYTEVNCPAAEQMCKQAVWITHPILLSDIKDIREIGEAIEKLWENREELKDGE